MIRLANYEDLHHIMKIIKDTIALMEADNNTQWDNSYPTCDDFKKDIDNKNLYVLIDEDILKGFICINQEEAAEYKDLKWSHDKEFLVVHRMAVNAHYRKRGIGNKLLNYADDLARKNGVTLIKTDTYSLNKKMNNLFKKSGYKKVGEVNFKTKPLKFNCYEKFLG